VGNTVTFDDFHSGATSGSICEVLVVRALLASQSAVWLLVQEQEGDLGNKAKHEIDGPSVDIVRAFSGLHLGPRHGDFLPWVASNAKTKLSSGY
jgi:hypothetical protein